jgi:ketosteroid isomerase-like protein
MPADSEFEYGNVGAGREEVEVVRAIYDAFARRDVEAALEHVDPDVTFAPEGTTRILGRTEPYRGHDGMREYFADVGRLWDQLTLHATDFRATGGGVVVFGHVEGTIDGKPFRSDAIWTWQIRRGKAISARVSPLNAPLRPE